MKRLKSSDDVEFSGERGVVKDWVRRDEDSGFNRSSSSLHRNSHYKSSGSGRKVLSSWGSRHERFEDDRESSRMVRKRTDYDVDALDRRKSYDRQRDGKDRGILSSSPRAGYGTDKMYRVESFSGPRRDFPKGFRSERDRSRRDSSVTSWSRYGSGKDGDDVARSGIEVSRGSRVGSEEIGKAKSPRVVRDVKSPAWSMDSGSERSKSVEVKKYDDKSAESGGPSTEREEGELEPDPHPPVHLTVGVLKDEAVIKPNVSQNELKSCANVKDGQDKDGIKFSSSEEGAENGKPKMVEDVENKIENLPDSGDTQETETAGETERSNDVKEGRKEVGFEEDIAIGSFDDNLSSLQQKNETKDIDHEMKVDRIDSNGNDGATDRSEVPLTEEMTKTWKDKGKSVIVSSSNTIHFEQISLGVEYKSRDHLTSGDMEMEGPSTRGFQFLSSDPIKKQEKAEQSNQTRPNDDKMALELSLSLPNVLLPISSHNRVHQAPGSPSNGGSIQSFASSFQTNSDMPSMSYSGSQQFTHNLSCSLTNSAYDFEQSVKSKPLFQGVDWKALSLDENKNKEILLYQGTSSKPKITGANSKELVGHENQLSFNKSLSGKQLVVSYDKGSESFKEQRQVSTQKDDTVLRRSFGSNRKDEILAFGADFAESVVYMIVSEPLHTMARRFSDMNDQHIACVKNFVLDSITNPGKQWKLNTLQNALRKRSDTLDMLVNANRTQLEILVALKSGLQEFLFQKQEILSSDLAEIFLNTRCRNLSCKSLLPVDECDCKICAKRNGFCRECMCLVCSKFDNASNTCSWVGCDVCLHWCHVDCGLKDSLIRNGHGSEMQFHCVACGHPSEMFGFVKEVFQNFLKEWTAENLCREFDYVRKIFAPSKDVRGKQLHEIVVGMMSVLGDRANHEEVQSHIMRFFTEADSLKPGNFPNESRKELQTKNQENRINSLPQIQELPTKDHEGSNGIAGSSQGSKWLKSTYPDKSTPSENLISGFENGRSDHQYTMNMDFRSNSRKRPVFDELESLVRIKHAEAKMFQTKADDARKEAEALKNISVAKNERIEEEYSSRIANLRLAEAEEMRRQKLEELQDVERAYHEYFGTKMRMETNIKDLLLKMEATRKNLST